MTTIDAVAVLPVMRHAVKALRDFGYEPLPGTCMADVVRLTDAGDLGALLRDHPVAVTAAMAREEP